MEELRQVVESYVGNDTECKVDTVGDWEPVEVSKHDGDVVKVMGVGERTSSRILDSCSFLSVSDDKLQRRLSQLSNLGEINVWMRVSEAEKERNGRRQKCS